VVGRWKLLQAQQVDWAKVHEELQASTVRQLQVPVTKHLLFVYSWNGKRRQEKAKE